MATKSSLVQVINQELLAQGSFATPESWPRSDPLRRKSTGTHSLLEIWKGCPQNTLGLHLVFQLYCNCSLWRSGWIMLIKQTSKTSRSNHMWYHVVLWWSLANCGIFHQTFQYLPVLKGAMTQSARMLTYVHYISAASQVKLTDDKNNSWPL